MTYSGWLTHISGHPSAAGRAQDRESSPARDRRSTTNIVPDLAGGGPQAHILFLASDRCLRDYDFIVAHCFSFS